MTDIYREEHSAEPAKLPWGAKAAITGLLMLCGAIGLDSLIYITRPIPPNMLLPLENKFELVDTSGSPQVSVTPVQYTRTYERYREGWHFFRQAIIVDKKVAVPGRDLKTVVVLPTQGKVCNPVFPGHREAPQASCTILGQPGFSEQDAKLLTEVQAWYATQKK